MSNLIQLLPDHVANQIAAGEVIQRPASVIKELVENAIDAGATEIKVLVKDAGRTYIQVMDNGCGMNEVDARMCFERHATSKIRTAGDIFKIVTKGFRGEALASIAAVAQVELKTRLHDADLGQHLRVEDSEVVNQQPIACAPGTHFIVKHLFYNTPARRNFLKSDAVEMKHIIEEFLRVAMVHNDVGFRLVSNEADVFNLPASNLRQRLVAIMGKSYNEKLVPVQQDTNLVRIHGFVAKPEFAKKTRGEQYLFVNQRFIKNNYLNHAIVTAFDDLLEKASFPSYFIYLELDPASIDINIHPTKTELKFQDERSLYAILLAAVKQSLGMYNIKPSLDFESEVRFELPVLGKTDEVRIPQTRLTPGYNPFNTSSVAGARPGSSFRNEQIDRDLHRIQQEFELPLQREAKQLEAELNIPQVGKERPKPKQCIPLFSSMILAIFDQELLLVDQRRAHERILFERYLLQLREQRPLSQQQLFPETVELSPVDHALILEISPALASAGLMVENFGGNTVVVNGMPVQLRQQSAKVYIESLLEQVKHFRSEPNLGLSEKLALSMARAARIKRGEALSLEEAEALVLELLSCDQPAYTAKGKACFRVLKPDELLNLIP